MRKPRRSVQIGRLLQMYPDVIERYDFEPTTIRPHQVWVLEGWVAPYWTFLGHKRRRGNGKKIFAKDVQSFFDLWQYVKPCDCDKCIGVARGSSLAVYRAFDWLAHDSRGLYHLLGIIATDRSMSVHLPLLTDEQRVLLDQHLETIQ